MMTHLWLLYLLCVTLALSKDLDCKKNSPLWPGTDKPSETENIKTWWADAKKEFDDMFAGKEIFELWDEFDLGRNPKLLEEINAMNYNTLECSYKFGPFWQRYKLGYDEKYRTPSMLDWDEKMAKKGIVADRQPEGEKTDWYLPLLYQTFYPYESEEIISQVIAAAKTYFKNNPGKILFIKGTLGGGTGTSIKWCDANVGGTAAPMYRLKEHDGWETHVPLCVKEVAIFTRSYKKRALENLEDENPSGTYGYPGLLLEPGYNFHVEVKTHLVWGKLLSIGTQTPFDCLHISNGYNGTFVRWRGYENDRRPTNEGDKTMWQVVQEAKAVLTDDMLKKVKVIAEGIAKHSDFLRVDIFINTDTGDMVVNEIESFYGVCGYKHDTHEEVMRVMARVWVEGWQKLEKQKRIKRVRRIGARYQDVAPTWDSAIAEPPCMPTEFQLKWAHDAGASSVVARGDWDHFEHDVPLTKLPDGSWSSNIRLRAIENRWGYKFIVDGAWTHDDSLPKINDGHNGLNNVLTAEDMVSSMQPSGRTYTTTSMLESSNKQPTPTVTTETPSWIYVAWPISLIVVFGAGYFFAMQLEQAARQWPPNSNAVELGTTLQ